MHLAVDSRSHPLRRTLLLNPSCERYLRLAQAATTGLETQPLSALFEDLSGRRGPDSSGTTRAHFEQPIQGSNSPRGFHFSLGRRILSHELDIGHSCATGSKAGRRLGPVDANLATSLAPTHLRCIIVVGIFEDDLDLGSAA